MDYSEARKNLNSPDRDIAERAFDCLLPVIGRAARQSAYPFQAGGLEIEDMVVQTYEQVWNKRRQYNDAGEYGLRSYVHLITSRLCLDELRKHRRRPDTVSLHDLQLSTDESELIDTLDIVLQAGLLGTYVDIALLGLDIEVSPACHTRPLLAAQYKYLEGATCREILRLIRPHAEEPPLSLAILERWLSDARVLRHLIYQMLWELHAQGSVNITAARLAVIQATAEGVVKQFSEAPGVDAGDVVCHDGLWQRLVFQLWYVAQWTLPEILEKIGPTATRFGYTQLTRNNLNMWLSGKRLQLKCVRFIQKQFGGPPE